MKQYCRYCNNAVQVDDSIIYCVADKQVMPEAKAKRVNRCKRFIFNEIDVFDLDRKYTPIEQRKTNRPADGGQISLFDNDMQQGGQNVK